jgi:putative transposase
LARALEDEQLLGRIRQVHAANYEANGYRGMWKALRRAGEPVARCRVQRLIPQVLGRAGVLQLRDRRLQPQRDFSGGAPDELWVADLSYTKRSTTDHRQSSNGWARPAT